MTQVIHIPAKGPIRYLDIDVDLNALQELVGGFIEAVNIPAEFGGESATAYVNEDGKFNQDCEPNMRATDFMLPGYGLMMGDWIAGSFLILGFDPRTGEHTEKVPEATLARVRIIDKEAA